MWDQVLVARCRLTIKPWAAAAVFTGDKEWVWQPPGGPSPRPTAEAHSALCCQLAGPTASQWQIGSKWLFSSHLWIILWINLTCSEWRRVAEIIWRSLNAATIWLWRPELMGRYSAPTSHHHCVRTSSLFSQWHCRMLLRLQCLYLEASRTIIHQATCQLHMWDMYFGQFVPQMHYRAGWVSADTHYGWRWHISWWCDF